MPTIITIQAQLKEQEEQLLIAKEKLNRGSIDDQNEAKEILREISKMPKGAMNYSPDRLEQIANEIYYGNQYIQKIISNGLQKNKTDEEIIAEINKIAGISNNK